MSADTPWTVDIVLSTGLDRHGRAYNGVFREDRGPCRNGYKFVSNVHYVTVTDGDLQPVLRYIRGFRSAIPKVSSIRGRP